MSNEINSTTDASRMVYSSREHKPSVKSDANPATVKRSSPGLDSVELTDRASQLRAMEERVASFPAVDAERVASVKQSIADGSYRIDAGKIAERMLQLDQQRSGS